MLKLGRQNNTSSRMFLESRFFCFHCADIYLGFLSCSHVATIITISRVWLAVKSVEGREKKIECGIVHGSKILFRNGVYSERH